MREFKFRAWDKRNNKWIHRDLFFMTNNAFYADYRALDDGESLFDYEYDLMQFTGLHDKNGVKIYEGDVVKLNSVNLRIYYSESQALYRAEGSNKWHYDINEIMEFYNCEVIGNIYENAELLEQK